MDGRDIGNEPEMKEIEAALDAMSYEQRQRTLEYIRREWEPSDRQQLDLFEG